MKIPNLTGKDYETVLKTVKGIVKASQRSDQKALEDGQSIKYVVEIYDKNDTLIEVKEVYSSVYSFEKEILEDLNLSPENCNVRGPFPLVEGALADSKLNRWENEKEKSEKDVTIVEKHFAEAEQKHYKYGYIVYEEVLGVKRFAELKFTDKALPRYKVNKMLRSSKHGHKRHVLRVKLSDGKEKLYE